MPSNVPLEEMEKLAPGKPEVMVDLLEGVEARTPLLSFKSMGTFFSAQMYTLPFQYAGVDQKPSPFGINVEMSCRALVLEVAVAGIFPPRLSRFSTTMRPSFPAVSIMWGLGPLLSGTMRR